MNDNQCLKYSILQSFLVMSDSLWPHGLQHARPPCPSPTPRVYSNSCPLSQWCHPATSSSVVPYPPAFNLSQGLFKWVSSLHQVAKVLELQLHISPFKEYSGLISFKIDWLDLLAFQRTLKSLLHHHSRKASVLHTLPSLLSYSHICTWPLQHLLFTDFLMMAILSQEKAMATHSSVLAWRIPGMGEPGGLLSLGLHRVGHDWSNLAAAAFWGNISL